MPGFPQLVNDYTRLFKSGADHSSVSPVSRTGDNGRERETEGGQGHTQKTREDQ